MAEQDERDPREGATPAGESPAARPEPPAPPAGGGQTPPPPGPGAPPPHGGAQAEFLESGRTAPPYVEGAAPPRESRWHRWSSNGTARAGALTLVAGLIGGLVGGGIVAAFNDDHGSDHTVRLIQRDGRDFGFGRRGFVPPNGGWGQYRRMPQPNQPQQPDQSGAPVPVPSPKASG
ncbi:hypothetical protein [Actinoallomurus sp. CA-142502]|uniref:hypothetical protein n=1 Tax=Actinoallomurus sp. CA-142502 TaxID=3239885 RepID=UPI003D89B781